MDIERFIRNYPFGAAEPEHSYDRDHEQQQIFQRYEAENRLLSAIAEGDEAAAGRALYAYGELMASPSQQSAPTAADPVRDFKNSVLVMNTLFRKAIEGSKVHPIYIHETSSDLGARIEAAADQEELVDLIREMLRAYCGLVREYSLAAYSPPVRKAIIFMDLNLSSPISTREIAADQFITPNYLSSRFKQETGKYLTEYLLERRITYARRLLRTTAQSVQTVAVNVGIDDGSYFSRQFKRMTGQTPLQYRAVHRRKTR